MGGRIVNNVVEGVSVYYPRLGFFHSPSEIRQALEVLSGRRRIDPEYLRLCFRKEPPRTTPQNEFLQALAEAAAARHQVELLSSSFDLVDVFLIEVSSLTEYLHPASGLRFISNPNLFRDAISYKEIYPDGFYVKYAPELGVVKRELTLEEVKACFTAINQIVGGRPVIYFGHLNHPERPSATRKKLNAVVREASAAAGCRYFDTEDLVKQFGFLTDGSGLEDLHHLSHEGEMALGKQVQEYCLANFG